MNPPTECIGESTARTKAAARPTRVLVTATMTLVVTLLPIFVLAAGGSLVRADLDFNEAQLGAMIASAFAMTSLFGFVGGRYSERFGPTIGMRTAAAISAASLLSIAMLVGTYHQLFLVIALAGAANGIAQPAVNLALARGAHRHQALMFGIQQSGVPITTMLAGAAVPLIALSMGWRWSFGLAALVALTIGFSVPRVNRAASTKDPQATDVAAAPIVLLAVGTAFGSAVGTALGSFLVESAASRGFELDDAGWLLVIGSSLGVIARVLAGGFADRLQSRHLLLVAAMIGVGSSGFLLLSLTEGTLFAIGSFIAFTFGFGWAGVLWYSVVRLNPNAPGAASGVVHVGAAAGAALGPLAFGLIVARHSFERAWSATAVAALLAGLLFVAARQWILHDGIMRGIAGRT